MSEKIEGIFLALVIEFFILRFTLKQHSSIEFRENLFYFKEWSSKERFIKYSSIKDIYFNQQGPFPTHVFVIKYKVKGKIKKRTFYASKEEFAQMYPFFEEKKINYTPYKKYRW